MLASSTNYRLYIWKKIKTNQNNKPQDHGIFLERVILGEQSLCAVSNSSNANYLAFSE